MAKICLVCSSGGHLFELYSLKKFWGENERFWVSFPTQDAQYLLSNEKVYWAFYPTNRSIVNLVRNVVVAWKILKREQPQFIVTTGAGVAVPFAYIAFLLKIKTIYIESITRIEELSLTGRMVYPVVDIFLVQWPDLEMKYKKISYYGKII